VLPSLLVGNPPDGHGFASSTSPLEKERSLPDATQAASRAGTITIDFTDPDALHREQLRSLSAEPARAVRGRVRNEEGHHDWPSPVDTPASLGERRGLVSASATAHPVEGWAACFARELLLVDAGRPAR